MRTSIFIILSCFQNVCTPMGQVNTSHCSLSCSLILPRIVPSTSLGQTGFVVIDGSSITCAPNSRSLPASLEEAARIDGANEFVVMTRIFIPISKPFMATFLLFYAVERWNEWWNAYLYISDKNIKPLQIYLRDVLVNFNSQLATQAQSMMSSHNKVFVQSIQMATIIITMLPILCVYPFVQKYFVKGVLVGSVKE